MGYTPWVFLDSPLEEIPISDPPYFGFVYEIRNTVTGTAYIGKKQFWSKSKKKVLLKNGKKKSKSVYVESDWKSYFGSSAVFSAEIEKYGADKFRRKILHLCRSKGECSYLEASEQFSRHVLLSDEYQNGWIMVRVRKDHLLKCRDALRTSLSLA